MKNKVLAVLILLAMSCSSPVELTGVDLDSWKSDRFGCKGDRLGEVQNVIDQQDILLGISADDLAATLGKPDQVELYKRSQKFLIYFLDPAPDCEQYEDDTEPRLLKIRVDALGRVKELLMLP